MQWSSGSDKVNVKFILFWNYFTERTKRNNSEKKHILMILWTFFLDPLWIVNITSYNNTMQTQFKRIVILESFEKFTFISCAFIYFFTGKNVSTIQCSQHIIEVSYQSIVLRSAKYSNLHPSFGCVPLELRIDIQP